MIRFLSQLLVRRTWFGQFDELYFVLNWLVMRCKLRPELAADAQHQHDRKCRLKSSQVKSIYFHHPSQGNSTNYCLILGPRDNAAPPTSQQIKNKNPSEESEEPSDTVIHFYFFLIHRRALLSANPRGNVRRIGRMFPEHVEPRSFLDPEYSFVAVRRILPTRFAKQKVRPIKNQLGSPNTAPN